MRCPEARASAHSKAMMTLVRQVRAQRRRRHLSIREAAPLIGISFSTLARLERGAGASPLTGRRLRAWLGEDVEVTSIEDRVAALEAAVFTHLSSCSLGSKGDENESKTHTAVVLA